MHLEFLLLFVRSAFVPSLGPPLVTSLVVQVAFPLSLEVGAVPSVLRELRKPPLLRDAEVDQHGWLQCYRLSRKVGIQTPKASEKARAESAVSPL
jgi:hypothetical protein